ncbi:Septin [Hanseniaspora valbyensis NRRL Y-1626]|uniref:Septin n=1 Tax=Hanseniaspora valbyensis NRRL Y-1626 TaxID=766949 RepID=A0A1B7TBB3_9ASCO|nr:Septin [Hanseniaspora valbyensis NRRL Y-1626]
MSSILASNSDFRKKKQLKRSIIFNVLIIGKPGSGRSTLINSLCGRNIVQSSSSLSKQPVYDDLEKDIPVSLRHELVELEDDNGVKIQLNVTDSLNLNNNINAQADIQLINNFITNQFDDVLLEENRLKRNPRFKDSRIHVCLYLLEPNGHGLKEFDIEFIKKIGERCNIVPVLSKADSMTIEELQLNKKLIRDDIKYYELPIFNFNDLANNNPDVVDDQEDEYNEYLNSILPFSVIGSSEVYNVDNEEIRGRKYDHFENGNVIIDIEDSTKSDFVTLRNVLFISHLNDFKEYTHEVLYERYRTETLSGNSNGTQDINTSSNKFERHVMPESQLANKQYGQESPRLNKDADASVNENIAASSSTVVQEDSNGTNNSYLAKEEQIRLEEEKLKQFEMRIQNELLLKRQELLKREEELREIEKRLELESQMK